MTKILFSSITKPIGIESDDLTGNSICEHIYPFIMKYDPLAIRTQYDHWPLDLIAANITAPSTVLHWPTYKQLQRELMKKDYDYLAIPVTTATFERAENMSEFARKIKPSIKIIYGGYPPEIGSADEMLIGEGISRIRKLLGEKTQNTSPIKHPLFPVEHYVAGFKITDTSGVILEKVGCNGNCDFCTTASYHPTPKILLNEKEMIDLFREYLDYGIYRFIVFNDDYLKYKERNLRIYRTLHNIGSLEERTQALTQITCFSRMDSVQQYDPIQLLEIGYNQIWIGVEDFSNIHSKNDYSKINDFIETMKDHGIMLILSSFIGSPTQKKEDCIETINKVIKLGAYGNQYTILTPFPHTRISNTLEITENRYKYFDGLHLVFRHPHLSKDELEEILVDAQKRDYFELGSSIMRAIDVKLRAYHNFKTSNVPIIKERMRETKETLEKSLAILSLAGHIHPNPEIKERIKEIQSRIVEEVGTHSYKFLLKTGIYASFFADSIKKGLERKGITSKKQPTFSSKRYNM